jgi:hypothetical protein
VAAGAESSPAADARWFIDTVDWTNDVGQYAAVTFDAHPQVRDPWVIHYDATNQHLRMARFARGGHGDCVDNDDWNCLILDSAGDVGKYSSIASNPVYRTHLGIAYHDATNGALKYIDYDPSFVPWQAYTIDKGIFPVSTTGLFTSIKHDSDDTPYIAYYFDNPTNVDALMVAYYVGSDGNCGYGAVAGKWQCDTIQTGEGVGQYASLALDGDGNRHIAYYDAGNGDLWYATSAVGSNCGPGNSWTCYPVSAAGDVGQYASMYVDSEDHFHIAYYDATHDTLNYAVEVPSGGNCGLFGSAQCDEIDDMMQGYNPLGVSIGEAAGYPIIAYQSQYGSLNVARPLAALGMPAGSGNCGPEILFTTWYCETIDRYGQFIPYRHGDYISIAVSPSGLAAIAYYGRITSGDGNLKVAYQRLQAFLPLVMKNQ